MPQSLIARVPSAVPDGSITAGEVSILRLLRQEVLRVPLPPILTWTPVVVLKETWSLMEKVPGLGELLLFKKTSEYTSFVNSLRPLPLFKDISSIALKVQG